ncbi:MAG: type II toxin-antitoxin system Phd/YefM family antitoxin [Ghiorsea sp.]|nr:type II toxin-antitoxin system Phd/YefM family antitoxin [Ghiorsea sp.]
MKVFTYSEARQNLSELLNTAQNEEVEIRRRDGSIFSIVPKTLRIKTTPKPDKLLSFHSTI